jgi:hypothetical protein
MRAVVRKGERSDEFDIFWIFFRQFGSLHIWTAALKRSATFLYVVLLKREKDDEPEALRKDF